MIVYVFPYFFFFGCGFLLAWKKNKQNKTKTNKLQTIFSNTCMTSNVFYVIILQYFISYMSRLVTKPTKRHVRPAKTQISLGIRPVWSVFAVCMKKSWVLNYPLSAQRRLWSDWADAQADLSLRWAHMLLCWFCHEAAHYVFNHFGRSLMLVSVFSCTLSVFLWEEEKFRNKWCSSWAKCNYTAKIIPKPF